jgi:hypothetical protein
MISRKSTVSMLASLLALAATLGVQAQPYPGRGPMAFGALDTDGNGYVSSEEFAQHRTQRMAARAAQGRLLRNAGQAPGFARWDANGDGQLSATELTSGQEARWAARQAGGRPCWRVR